MADAFVLLFNRPLDISGIILRRLDAGGEELDEFGAVDAEGGEGK